jgi:hypothetical protein
VPALPTRSPTARARRELIRSPSRKGSRRRVYRPNRVKLGTIAQAVNQRLQSVLACPPGRQRSASGQLRSSDFRDVSAATPIADVLQITRRATTGLMHRSEPLHPRGNPGETVIPEDENRRCRYIHGRRRRHLPVGAIEGSSNIS